MQSSSLDRLLLPLLIVSSTDTVHPGDIVGYPVACLYPTASIGNAYPCAHNYPTAGVYPRQHGIVKGGNSEAAGEYLSDGATANISTVPMMGSSSNTSLSQLAAMSSISMCPTEGASTNTSTCGHVDSCETSQSMERSSSTVTAYNTSGYNAGPSHR